MTLGNFTQLTTEELLPRRHRGYWIDWALNLCLDLARQ